MRWKIGIAGNMIGAFVVILLIVAATGTFAVLKIGEVNSLSAEMRSRWLPATQLLGNLHAYTSQYRITQSALLTARNDEEKNLAKTQLKNQKSAISGILTDYQPLIENDDQRKQWEEIVVEWNRYESITDRMVTLVESNDKSSFLVFNNEGLDEFYKLEDGILNLIDLNLKDADQTANSANNIYIKSRMAMILVIFGSVIICIVLSFWIFGRVARPIQKMSDIVKRIVDGDLAVVVPGTQRGDELGSLARAMDSFKLLFATDQQRALEDARRAIETQATIDAIGSGLSALAQGRLTHQVSEDIEGPLAQLHVDYNAAVTNLSETMDEIVSGTGVICDGAAEIASASSDLSLRTERQAQTLAHVSQTLIEFNQSVRATSDHSAQTSEKLALARRSAKQVDQTAKQAVAAMRSIGATSREMNEIISAIDALAFQTNLLALNAGVEAARAGDAGRGFAVVANEVRALAKRSSDAANHIRELVVKSGNEINRGVELVEHSEVELKQIVDQVSEVAELAKNIANTSAQQATSLHEITEMVSDMDLVTQQNAAMVEESTASSRSLSVQTQRLADKVSFFETGVKLCSYYPDAYIKNVA